MQHRDQSRRCRKCAYSGKYDGTNICCMYWEIMDRKRPCPPGDDCTVFQPRTVRHRKVPQRI